MKRPFNISFERDAKKARAPLKLAVMLIHIQQEIMLMRIKSIQILLIILMLSLISKITFAEEGYGFRHTKWGMSKEEVMNNENGDPLPDFLGKTLAYKSELWGENVLIVYTFQFNKLIRAKYMLLKYFAKSQQKRFAKNSPLQNPFPGECIADFGKFENALIEKYGKPVSQDVGYSKEIDVNNKNRTDREDGEVMENAIRQAKGYWSSKWKTEDTDILLLLHGGKGDLAFEISYSSINLEHLEKDLPL